MSQHVLTNDPRLIEALKFQGNYNPANTYTQNDVVVLCGVFYLSLVSSNTGNSPLSSFRQWAPFAGIPGTAASVGVGTTTTGGVGTPAAVNNSGTPQNAILDFTIPTGQGFNFRGAWQPSTAYNPYDVVVYGGQTWFVAASFTSGEAFDSTNLVLMAAGGAIVNSPVADTITVTEAGNNVSLSQAPYDNTLVALFYGGGFLRQGGTLGDGVDYTVAGKVVTLNFSVNVGDTISALYFSANSASVPNLIVEAMTRVSTRVFTTSHSPAQNFLWLCFYNGGFLAPTSFTFTGTTLTTDFDTIGSDNIYAIYPPA